MSRSENMASSLVLEFLCSSQKIERDRGVVELNKLLNTADDAEVKRLEASVQSLLEDATLTWESKHGALMGTKTLLSHEKCSDEFVLLSKDYALRLLEHNESRVRLSAGALTCQHGPTPTLILSVSHSPGSHAPTDCALSDLRSLNTKFETMFPLQVK